MNVQTKSGLVLICSILLLLACSKEKVTIDDSFNPKLGIEVYEDDVIVGEKVVGNHTLKYEVTGQGSYNKLTLKIDSFTLLLETDYDKMSILQDGGDAILNSSQKSAIEDWALTYLDKLLVRTRGTDDFTYTLVENTLLMSLMYWAEAPEEYVFSRIDSNTENLNKSLRNDGVICVIRGQTYTIQYDIRYGFLWRKKKIITKQEEVNTGTNCNGLCGRGCNLDGTPFQCWSLDCLEHDSCTYNEKNIHCWDEFAHCVDDFLYGQRRRHPLTAVISELLGWGDCDGNGD